MKIIPSKINFRFDLIVSRIFEFRTIILKFIIKTSSGWGNWENIWNLVSAILGYLGFAQTARGRDVWENTLDTSLNQEECTDDKRFSLSAQSRRFAFMMLMNPVSTFKGNNTSIHRKRLKSSFKNYCETTYPKLKIDMDNWINNRTTCFGQPEVERNILTLKAEILGTEYMCRKRRKCKSKSIRIYRIKFYQAVSLFVTITNVQTKSWKKTPKINVNQIVGLRWIRIFTTSHRTHRCNLKRARKLSWIASFLYLRGQIIKYGIFKGRWRLVCSIINANMSTRC